MARTQAAEYEERRERIVEQAARLFARDGFLGVSVSELAEACKISKSLIYHYYLSKEDILFEVMHSHVLALDEAARAVAASDAAPADKLRTLTHDFMRLYVGASDRHKVLLNALDYLPKPQRTAMVTLQRELIGIVETLLAAVAPRLKKRPGASRAAAMLYFGMINWTHTWYDPQGPVSPEQLADMAVDLTLNGLSGID